jgi:hypothetical protein
MAKRMAQRMAWWMAWLRSGWDSNGARYAPGRSWLCLWLWLWLWQWLWLVGDSAVARLWLRMGRWIRMGPGMRLRMGRWMGLLMGQGVPADGQDGARLRLELAC